MVSVCQQTNGIRPGPNQLATALAVLLTIVLISKASALSWSQGPQLPASLGETTSCVMPDGSVIVVGQGSSTTYLLNAALTSWSTLPSRPYPGNHHSSVTRGNICYLVGGLGGGNGMVRLSVRKGFFKKLTLRRVCCCCLLLLLLLFAAVVVVVVVVAVVVVVLLLLCCCCC